MQPRRHCARKMRGPPQVVQFWRALMLVPGYVYAKARVRAFKKLAGIQLCMVGTSVEDGAPVLQPCMCPQQAPQPLGQAT